MDVFPPTRAGAELAGYRLDEVVGRGGMGVVYRAHDLALDRPVALKLLAPELAEDHGFRNRFLVESRLAAALDHPNVVPVYDAGQVDDQLYIAMRYVDGTDLKALLATDGKLAPQRALEVLSQVADALDAAHARGLVHRDVKPSNVLLDERGHAYLADFGLTRRLTEQAPGFDAGFSLGTPAYVAPEQIEGAELDGRADQYSLACLLYECLVGKPPFSRSSEAAILFAHLEEEPPTLPRLEGVLSRGLAKKPEERYGSCRELVEAARQGLGVTERRRSVWPLALVASGAALLGAALLTFFLGQGSAGPTTLEGNAVAVLDAHSNRVVDEIPVGAGPEAIASGSGSLWVANVEDRTVARIDPATRRVRRSIPVLDTPMGIAATPGAVWVVGSEPTNRSVSVRRIDPRFNAVGGPVEVSSVAPELGAAVATRRNTVWVAPSFGLLTRLDPKSSKAVQKIDPNAGPTNLAVGAAAVWITDADANSVTRIGRDGRRETIPVGRGPSGIALGAGGVWVVDSLDDAVLRIDADTRRVAKTIPVGRGPAGIAFGSSSVWVANRRDGTVTRIDPSSGKVVATIEVGGSPQAIAVTGGRVWVTVQSQTGGSSAGGAARLVAETDIDRTLDPALAVNNAQLEYPICAKLVNYPDRAGPAGSRLVPEVAQALPARSADGRTYTFTIRRGFRFSPPSGEPVTAQTFKYSLERALSPRMQSYLGGYFGDIVGAQAYMAGKAPHIAGIVARRNRLLIRLRAPAGDLPARLAMPIACAVPLGTPLDPGGVRLIPSAGPYFVASYTPGQGVVLERNPNYSGNRPHRLGRIEVAFGVSSQKAAAQIESRGADYALEPDAFPPGESTHLAARYGPGHTANGAPRYFLNPRPSVHFLLLNTHRPLFRSLRLRRAVNFAVDRRTLARIGPAFQSAAQPTDQYLPPGTPGFRDVRVYPSTPDLLTARRLAGHTSRTAVLYTCNESTCRRLAQAVKTQLRAIGITVDVKAFPSRVLYDKYATGSYDLALASWFPDYADPSAALDAAVEGGFGLPVPALAPVYRRTLAAAAKLSGPARYIAYRRLDAELARNAAPWVAYANSLSTDFFSSRIGCQVYQPVYGMDLAGLCIRRR